MRRLVLSLIPTLLLAALFGGAALAQAGGSDPEGDTPGRPDVFRYYSRTAAEAFVPAIGGPPPEDEETPPSVGDVTITRDDLFALDPATNGPTGEAVGTLDAQCTFVRVDLEAFSADLLCTGVVTLPRGMITLQTKLSFSEESGPEFVVPITGGSGAYADAGGRLVVHGVDEDGDEGGAAIFEFRLLHLALQP